MIKYVTPCHACHVLTVSNITSVITTTNPVQYLYINSHFLKCWCQCSLLYLYSYVFLSKKALHHHKACLPFILVKSANFVLIMRHNIADVAGLLWFWVASSRSAYIGRSFVRKKSSQYISIKRFAQVKIYFTYAFIFMIVLIWNTIK